MPRVQVNGIKLYYEIHGEGAPLVMIIGFGESSEGWSWFFGASPDEVRDLGESFKLILFDNRGTGRSDKPDVEYSIRMMADDVAGLMEAIKVPKAHVFGASMGGMIAQELALNYPEKVNKLILTGTTCGGPNSIRFEDTLTVAQTIVDKLKTVVDGNRSKEEYLEWFWNLFYTRRYIEENRELLLEGANILSKHPTPLFAYRRQLQAISNHDTYNRLPEIKAPTLVIAGELDSAISAENFRILVDRIPNAELKLLEGVGHAFTRDVWDQTKAAILDFLTDN